MLTSYNFKTIKNLDSINFLNRSFLYGEGFFETIIVSNNHIKFLDDHYSRISNACKAHHLQFDYSVKDLENHFFDLLNEDNSVSSWRIKMIVWRKNGTVFKSHGKENDILITATPLTSHEKSSKLTNVGICQSVRNHFSSFSSFKRTSSMHYTLAGMECSEKKWDDIVLLDYHSNISECLTSNLFWVKGAKVFTPSIKTGCIEGIMRKNIIRFLNLNKIPVVYAETKIDQFLDDAEYAFSTNVARVIPIEKIEGKLFADNEIGTQIMQQFS